MKINIICVGKKHDINFASAIVDYERRLGKVCTINWQVIPSQKSNQTTQITKESNLILQKIKKLDIVILLDETGRIYSNLDLAKIIEDKLQSSGQNNIVFVIGGAFGVSSEVKDRADFSWSLSNLSFRIKS